MTEAFLQELESGTKSAQIKKQIIAHFIDNGPSTITDLSKILMLSVPTVAKLITELMDCHCVKDYGKLETAGGRHPLLYGLEPKAGHFIGVDVQHRLINIGLIDMLGNLTVVEYDLPYLLEDEPEKIDELCDIIKDFIARHEIDQKSILNININMPGRINPSTGHSFTYFKDEALQPLSGYLKDKIGCNVSIDNDTRGMIFGEYTQGGLVKEGEKNILYLNLSWGVGLGIILCGKVYVGKSGFSGEFGHVSYYDNEILCQCGKKGCLQTETSGWALHTQVIERIKQGETSILSPMVEAGESIKLDDIIQAIKQEDVLCLEVIEQIGRRMGRQVAALINVFNPDLVIIGGSLSNSGDVLTDAIQSVVRIYSLNVVNCDTRICTASLGDRSGVIGACMMALSRRFSEV